MITTFFIGLVVGVALTGAVWLFVRSRQEPTSMESVSLPKLRPIAESKTALEIARQKEKEHLEKLEGQKLADELNKNFSNLEQM